MYLMCLVRDKKQKWLGQRVPQGQFWKRDPESSLQLLAKSLNVSLVSFDFFLGPWETMVDFFKLL